MTSQISTLKSLALENEELRARLLEAEDTLNAIRNGLVDALVMTGPLGDQVFTLEGADRTYRRLVEEMSEGAVVLTTNGGILYCNQRFADMVRLPLESVMGRPLSQYFTEADQARLTALLEAARTDRGAQELTLSTQSDSLPVHLSATCLKIGEEPTICAIITDLTEQRRSRDQAAANMKRLEEEQTKANKLEALGILAGGLAHDLNNSLTAIFGNISIVQRSLRNDSVALKRLGEAEMACMQARDITEQLLTFSKGGAPVRETASIADSLKDWTSFALSGSNVECLYDIAPDLRFTEIDKGQIGRVINNLVINAQHAMPEGGQLIIRASNVTLGDGTPEQALPLPLPPGEYVCIDIQDAGIGIPEALLPKIFDPYFTTKQKGSGLGLSVAYSIVKNHRGFITVESEAGVGTTFHIYLPASNNVPGENKGLPEPEKAGRLKVLIMDDQDAVRDVIFDILVHLEGHEVEFAEDGIQALELYQAARESGSPFDVLLMDLTIPGHMGGKEAIGKLLELDPHVKAIVVSGYSNDPIMAHFADHGFKGVVRKPFGIEELLDTIYAVARSSE